MTMGGMRFMLPAHLLAVLVMAGCAAPPPAVTLDTVAEGYVRVALQLAQHDPSLVESWRGPDTWRPGPRVPVAGLLEQINRVARDLDTLPPAGTNRHDYLAGQLRALQFAARRLMGAEATIDDQARDEFGVSFSRIEPARVAELHEAIGQALAGPGPLAERVTALKARTAVPAGRRQAVMDAALAACRRASSAAVALPATERATVSFSNGLGWDGYARYLGGHRTDIAINGDGTLDVSRALRLACHEGYPGHHVQYLLLDELAWPELGLAPAFGPHLLYAEGAAEAGADLAFTIGERVTLLRDQLLPLAGLPPVLAGTMVRVESLVGELVPVVTDVARQYLAGALARPAAIDRLRREALLTNPEGILTLIEQRRARALVYAEGRRLVYARMGTASLPALNALFTRAVALQ
jgi:hypothetical protein